MYNHLDQLYFHLPYLLPTTWRRDMKAIELILWKYSLT